MRRLAVIDWLLIGISLPILLFGLAMSLVHGVRGDFVAPTFWVTTAANNAAYPVVDRVWSPAGTEPNPLAVGDRVLRIEEIDLRGASNAGFWFQWSKIAQAGVRSLRLTVERGAVRSEVRVPLVPGYYIAGCPPWWTMLPFMVGLMCTALLLLVRAAHWHLARRNYVASVLLATWFIPYFTVATAPWAEIIGDVVIIPLAQALFLWNLAEFLPGLGLWSAGLRALAWGLALLQSAAMAALFWWPDAGTAPSSLIGITALAFSLANLVVLTRVYRLADPLGRRQIKWVVYGFYVALLPWLVGEVYISLDVADPGRLALLPSVAQLALVAIPLGFLIAIAFYQLLDIDRLFSATLSYSILAILGLAMMLGVMPLASRSASDALGIDPAGGQVVVALGMAAVLVSVHRIVSPWIDRRLFPERATLERGFEDLLGEIAHVVDMPELTRLVSIRLDSLLGPGAVVLYARAGDVFTPLVVRGRSGSPTFAARSALVASLQERTTPLAAKRWASRRTAPLTLFERAAIETLDVAVVVPIRDGGELAGFWGLGRKRSGDIYTATDLALLGAAAAATSDRLAELGGAEATAEAFPRPDVGDDDGALTVAAAVTGESARGVEGNGWVSDQDARANGAPCAARPADAPGLPSIVAAEPDSGAFHHEGEYWTLAYRGKTARLRDTKGLHYIARLLSEPGGDIHVRDLTVTDDAPHTAWVDGPIGEVLDGRAATQYRERLAEARRELDEATRSGDFGCAARARHEVDSIEEQLAAAYGLGGRSRVAGDPAERQRKAVGNQIRRALDRICAVHPELGRHLKNALRTGFVCTYRPEDPVAWQL